MNREPRVPRRRVVAVVADGDEMLDCGHKFVRYSHDRVRCKTRLCFDCYKQRLARLAAETKKEEAR